jgi:hypothetical protein
MINDNIIGQSHKQMRELTKQESPIDWKQVNNYLYKSRASTITRIYTCTKCGRNYLEPIGKCVCDEGDKND